MNEQQAKARKPKSNTDCRAHARHTLNTQYFKNIDTPEKAYLLGFTFADGHNNTTNYNVAYGLQLRDVEILDFIKNQLEFTGDYKIQEYNKANPHYKLSVYSKELSTDLLNLGVHNNKSYGCNFPTIPKQLHKYFILGYFDGDGSCGHDKKGQFLFSIVGNESILLEIMYRLINITNSKCTLRYSKLNLMQFAINGNKNKVLLREYLYTGHSLGLKRKKQKFYE